jgi:hypothetical protein
MKTIVSHFIELQIIQTEGKEEEITIPKDQLLPYPLVGVYSTKAKPTMVYPPAGTVVTCVLVCGSVVVVLVMVRRYYNRSKSTHGSDAGK